MVIFKKSFLIILILFLLLSLIPNFLYTGERAAFAEDQDPCENLSCPDKQNCEKKYDDKTKTCVCYNCSVSCKWKGENVINKSCSPLTVAEEWGCGIEIPIGEITDNTSSSAGKMLKTLEGMIKSGEEMALWTDRVLTDYKEWKCSEYINWEGEEKKCETGCRKYYQITAGSLQAEESDQECESETSRGKTIDPQDCNENHIKCLSCSEYCDKEEYKEECCWVDNTQLNPNYDPENEKENEYLSCKYCRKQDEGETKYCNEYCSAKSCEGCCSQYFNPIINGYKDIKNSNEALKNQIEETDTLERFQRRYILEQLDFSRCELAQCWVSAEEYLEIPTEEKIGKHLLTCKQASQTGLLEEDQIACFAFQAVKGLEEIIKLWEDLETASWWKKLIIYFQLQWEVVKFSAEILWEMATGGLELTQEKGCYPGNYYCCQL